MKTNTDKELTIFDVETRIASLKKQIAKTEKDLVSNNTLYSRETIEQVRLELKDRLKKARAKLKELKAQLPCKNKDSVSKYSFSIEIPVDFYKAMNRENDIKSHPIPDDFKSNIPEFDARIISDLQSSVESLKAENKRLTNSLYGKIVEDKSTIVKLKDVIDSNEHDLKALQVLNERLEAENEMLRNSSKDIQSDNKNAVVQVKVLTIKCNILKSQINCYKNDLESLNDEIKNKDKAIKHLTNKLEVYRKRLSICGSTANMVIKDGYEQNNFITELENRIKILEKQLNTHIGLNNVVKSSKDELAKSYNELVEKINNINSMTTREFSKYKKNPFVVSKLKF